MTTVARRHILAEPPAEGFDLALYVVPPIAFIGSVGLIAMLLRRMSRQAPIDAPGLGPADNSDPGARAVYDVQLDEDLRELD